MRVLRWAALAVWALITVAASAWAGGLDQVETNDVRNWLPATAESTRALDLADPGPTQTPIVVLTSPPRNRRTC